MQFLMSLADSLSAGSAFKIHASSARWRAWYRVFAGAPDSESSRSIASDRYNRKLPGCCPRKSGPSQSQEQQNGRAALSHSLRRRHPPVLGAQLLIESSCRLSIKQMISRFAYLRAETSTGSCHDEENVLRSPKTATVLMQAQRASIRISLTPHQKRTCRKKVRSPSRPLNKGTRSLLVCFFFARLRLHLPPVV